jgi:hypothetical protein
MSKKPKTHNPMAKELHNGLYKTKVIISKKKKLDRKKKHKKD